MRCYYDKIACILLKLTKVILQKKKKHSNTILIISKTTVMEESVMRLETKAILGTQ